MADVNAANQIVFDPSGYIKLNGDTSYGLVLAMNDGYYNGSWYNSRIDQNKNAILQSTHTLMN